MFIVIVNGGGQGELWLHFKSNLSKLQMEMYFALSIFGLIDI